MKRALTTAFVLLLTVSLVVQELIVLLFLRNIFIRKWEEDLLKISENLSYTLSQSSSEESFYENSRDIKVFSRGTTFIILDKDGFTVRSIPDEHIERYKVNWFTLSSIIDSLRNLETLDIDRSVTIDLIRKTLEDEYRGKFRGEVFTASSLQGLIAIAPVKSAIDNKLLGFSVVYRDLTPLYSVVFRTSIISILILTLISGMIYLLVNYLTDRILLPLRELEMWSSEVSKAIKQEKPADIPPPKLSSTYEELQPLIESISNLTAQIALYSEEVKRKKASLEKLLSTLPLWIVTESEGEYKLYGSIPEELRDEVTSEISEGTTVITWNSRYLEVRVLELDEGKLWLIRDITEEYERERVRDEILGILSHELRTPLTSIKGFAITLEDMLRTSEEVNPYIIRAIRYIQREVERLSSMVEEMLTLARLKLRKLKLELGEVRLSEFLREIRDIIESFSPRVKEKGLKLNFKVSEELKDLENAYLTLDLSKIKQVILNLLDNALKHAKTQIDVEIDREGGWLVILVRNDGERLSPRALLEIFERYVSTRGSLGIGLTISKEIVEQHNGKIEARNWEKGVLFKVKLPLKT